MKDHSGAAAGMLSGLNPRTVQPLPESLPARLWPMEMAEHTVESLYAMHGAERAWIYWLVLLGTLGALGSLPLIQVDVSVRAPGMVRPATGRTELRPAVSGQIAQVMVRDNEQVKAGQILLILSTGDLDERLARNQALQNEQRAVVADLKLLTAGGGMERDNLPPDFQTTVLRQELVRHLAQINSYRLAESKAGNELVRYTALTGKGIATQQDLDNVRYEAARLQAESKLFAEQALAHWQVRLQEACTVLAGLRSDEQRLKEERTHSVVRAPVDGVLVGFSGWTPGGFVATGQVLGVVSPDGALLVESQVVSRDIGLIRVGQTARLQIDAFPYAQWGTLEAVVTSISGDLLVGTGAEPPVFKVTLRPATACLILPNGLRAQLMKGLTLSARFLVARRSLLQLLYDDASALFNPQDNRATH